MAPEKFSNEFRIKLLETIMLTIPIFFLYRHKSKSSAVPSSLSKSMYEHNEEMKDAMKYMDEIYSEVMGQIEQVPQYEEIKPILVRLREAIDYTVPYGKRFKGVHIVSHFKLLADPKFITPENVKLSRVLGWCAEIVSTKRFTVNPLLEQLFFTDPSIFLYAG